MILNNLIIRKAPYILIKTSEFFLNFQKSFGIIKNYLTEKEIDFLNRLVSMYLDYAEVQAENSIPMTMEDWSNRLDSFIEFNGRDLLMDAGKISAEQAKLHAETQFEKYRIVQDQLFKSDFDLFLEGYDE
mgnify:FL=1